MTQLVNIQPISDSEVKAGAVTFRPACSPGVLDTGTWDVGRASAIVRDSAAFLQGVAPRVVDGTLAPNEAASDSITLYPASIKSQNGVAYILAGLRDGQRVLLAFGEDKDRIGQLRGPFSGVQVEALGKASVALIPTDTDNVVYFVENIAPPFGPQPMGTTPRLGIGDRMTSLVFPGGFDALAEMRLAGNIIQNSIGRELAPVARLLSGEPLPQTYLPGLGTLHTGHTGTSIEGLWLEGVLWGIQLGASAAPWGADADHAPVKRSTGSEGMDRAKELLHASRNYTFFTMDTSDLFDYRAGKVEGAALQQLFEEMVPNAVERQALLDRHTQLFEAPAVSGQGGQYHPTAEQTVRFVVKYWRSLSATETLNQYVASLRGKRGYDFEFSMDERPLDISALESVTPDEEVIFVLRELKARGVRCTHVAPNFGVEKGVDYRLPDGLDGWSPAPRAWPPSPGSSASPSTTTPATTWRGRRGSASPRAPAGRWITRFRPSCRRCTPRCWPTWTRSASAGGGKPRGIGPGRRRPAARLRRRSTSRSWPSANGRKGRDSSPASTTTSSGITVSPSWAPAARKGSSCTGSSSTTSPTR